MPKTLDRAVAFPLYGIVDTPDGPRCGCGDPSCPPKRAGKHTWVKWGQLKPGQRLGGVEGRDNLAYATGSRSGFFVLDVDGPGTLPGPIPETYTVRTPTSVHYYFLLPDFAVKTSSGELEPGLDIRGEGGLVVAAGSRHRTGGAYVVEKDVEIAEAPAWLLARPELRKEAPGGGELSPGAAVLPPSASEAAKVLAGAWPKSDHDARLALAGALSRDYSLEATEAFLTLVCGEPEKASKAARDAFRGLEEGRTTWGWSQVEKICGGAAVKARKLLAGVPEDASAMFDRLMKPAIKKAIEEGNTRDRRTKDPAHVYTHTPGDAPAPERSKLCVSDAISVLRTHPEWAGVWAFDTFRDRVVCINPPVKLDAETKGLTEEDGIAICTWFEREGATVAPMSCFSAALAAAKCDSFHPVRAYLEALPPSDLNLDEVCTRALGNTGAIEGVFLRLWLISAVRRVLLPGCQADNSIILVGAQGAGKSSFGRILGAPWNAEELADLSSKDAAQGLRGAWLVEVAELDRVLRAEESTSKAFITRSVDRYRPSYGRGVIEQPRECVFFGTTNREDILRDVTGGRRYWPIRVGAIDRAWLEANRDPIWRAAYDAAKAGEAHWLDTDLEKLASEHRESFREEDAWEESIRLYLHGRKTVTSKEVFEKTIGGETERFGRRELLRITDTLRRLGCESRRDKNSKWWGVPPSLAELPLATATFTPSK